MHKPWNCHVRCRFASVGWDFATWEEAFAYAKQRHANTVRDVSRFPSYQGLLSDYRAVITDENGTKWILFSEYFGEGK